ncbi:MAG: hypothetical protein WC313_00145 [Candidatus Kapaibacterium sp.]
MSNDLIERRDAGYKLTSFYGGDARGVCLQITALNGDGFIQLDRSGADLLIQDVRHLFLEKQDEARTELEAAEKRLVKTETELLEARRVQGQMSKELEALRERLAQTERNLARAQGYIDRVTEGEPPLPGVRKEVHERVGGSVGVSYIHGPEPRGPKLDLGEPYNLNGYGLSR